MRCRPWAWAVEPLDASHLKPLLATFLLDSPSFYAGLSHLFIISHHVRMGFGLFSEVPVLTLRWGNSTADVTVGNQLGIYKSFLLRERLVSSDLKQNDAFEAIFHAPLEPFRSEFAG